MYFYVKFIAKNEYLAEILWEFRNILEKTRIYTH